jgi:CheY-like chemotaxis protein
MPKTLLLADDSVTIQKVVGISFANEDVRIVTVDNGDDAVVRAKEIRPDIVLADVVMPGKSGYEVCAALKGDPALAHIPVLLLTGTFETFDEDRAARVGADGHITKPFEAQALVELVSARLAAAAPARATAPAGAKAAPAAEPEPFDFLEPEAATASRPSAGTARPVAGASDDAFAFDAEPLDAIDLETEDDAAIDLGNEATAARTTLLLDDDDGFARAATAPPVAAPSRPATPAFDDDASELTRLVLPAAPKGAPPSPAPAAEVDPLSDLQPFAADPFLPSDESQQWDVASDELSESFPTDVIRQPAPASITAVHEDATPPAFTAPLFDDDAGAEFELTEAMPPPVSARAIRPAPAPVAAAAPAAPAASPELSAALRDSVHETLEKIAWEALGDVSERIVREAVARIEQVAWDVIPRLTETLIREEIRKLKGE